MQLKLIRLVTILATFTALSTQGAFAQNNTNPNDDPDQYAGIDPIDNVDPSGNATIEQGASFDITFQGAHAARHLVGTVLTQPEVEAAVAEAVQEIASTGSLTDGFWGWVEVRGVGLIFRAMVLSDILVSVGTYYPR